jgi:hypothetical protein
MGTPPELPPEPQVEPGPGPGIPEPPAPAEPQPAIPEPPGVAAAQPPDYQTEQARALFQALGDARTRPQALEQILRQYGYLPEAVPIDHVADALNQYGEFLTAQPGMEEGEEEATGAPLDLNRALAQMGLDPRLVQQQSQRIEQLEQALAERAEADTRSLVQGAVDRVAQTEGLDPTGHQILLSNVAFALGNAVQAGRQVDFSNLDGWVGQVLASLRSFGQASMNTEIARHRGLAPRTTTPAGAGQAGASAGRGMSGAEMRAQEALRQAEQARASGR